MKAFHIYHRGTRIAQLCRQLRIPVVIPREGIRLLKGRTAVLAQAVNWGCSKDVPADCLNASIRIAQSKVRTFEAFAAAGIPHPRWNRDYRALTGELGLKASILGRKDFLSGGAGIEIISPEHRASRSPIPHADFYVERLSYYREFRVHVWLGKIIVEQIKWIERASTNPIHSYTNGATFAVRPLDEFLSAALAAKARDLAPRAVKAAGIDFAAVDFFVTKKQNLYVLEVNSAPGVRDSCEDAYIAVLRGLIVSNGRESQGNGVRRLQQSPATQTRRADSPGTRR